MKRKWIAIFFALLLSLPVHAADRQVIAVGRAVGIDVSCGGLLVVGFAEDSPARDSGLRRGDLIERVDGAPVSEPEALRALLQDKTQVVLTALRDDREKLFVVPLPDEPGQKAIGASVKTHMAGVGTVTWYDPATSIFGALGHGVADEVTGALFPLREGFLCRATVIGADRGRPGAPGMLQGAFDAAVPLGTVAANTPCGIFGTMSAPPEGLCLPIAAREEITTGPAELLCNVEGDQVERFSVEIQKIYPQSAAGGRNMLLRVTDRRLLQKTGGIVQGMSGSPILQNGKLVGALTHVLVADPQIGYGIFIDAMLETGLRTAAS